MRWPPAATACSSPRNPGAGLERRSFRSGHRIRLPRTGRGRPSRRPWSAPDAGARRSACAAGPQPGRSRRRDARQRERRRDRRAGVRRRRHVLLPRLELPRQRRHAGRRAGYPRPESAAGPLSRSFAGRVRQPGAAHDAGMVGVDRPWSLPRPRQQARLRAHPAACRSTRPGSLHRGGQIRPDRRDGPSSGEDASRPGSPGGCCGPRIWACPRSITSGGSGGRPRWPRSSPRGRPRCVDKAPAQKTSGPKARWPRTRRPETQVDRAELERLGGEIETLGGDVPTPEEPGRSWQAIRLHAERGFRRAHPPSRPGPPAPPHPARSGGPFGAPVVP